jgi:hypothetical protein
MKAVELGISGESNAYIEVVCRLDCGRIECYGQRPRALQKLADLLKTRIWVEQQLSNDGFHNLYINMEEQLISSSNEMGVESVHDRNN